MGSANPIAAVAGPVLNLAGGLISGGKSADAYKGQADALRAAAERASAMAMFNPYGMTTNFGTSKFEDGRGSYTLSPQLQALQSRLFAQLGYGPQTTTQQVPQLPEGYSLTAPQAGLGTAYTAVLPKTGFTYAYSPTGERIEVPLVSQTTPSQGGQGYSPEEFTKQIAPISGGAASLFGLGQQYLGQSPQEISQKYVADQQALLASSREAAQARLGTTNFARGTGGLGVNTGTGGAPANPAAQALYNAQAQQDLEIAARADQAAMDRAKFGAGLFGTGGELLRQIPSLTTAGYGPLEAQLGLLGTTEKLGQQPFLLSQDLANQYSRAGAAAGQLYMQPQQAAANAYSQYQGYSPMGSALSAVGSTISPGGAGASWFSDLLGGSSGRGAGEGYSGMNRELGLA